MAVHADDEASQAGTSTAKIGDDAAIILHQGRASEHYNRAEYREAIAEWSEVLKIDPANTYALESIQRAQTALKPSAAPDSQAEPDSAPVKALESSAPDGPRNLIPPVSERKFRFAAALDVFFVADAADGWKKEFQNSIDAASLLLGPTSGTFETTPAAGVRVLFLRRFGEFEIGPSIGFIGGPSGLGKADTLTTAGVLHTEAKIETAFVRPLLEVRSVYPIAKRVALQMGLAAGYARGKMKQMDKFTGVVNQTDTFDESWGGFTWEISPALVFEVHPVTIEFGIRYAHFPQKSESSNFSEFKWNPFGIYTAIGF